MYEPFDRERVRQLAEEILRLVSAPPVVPEVREPRPSADEGTPEEGASDVPLTTAELAVKLGVSQAWITKHVDLFPGAFRLSDSQRANYRFPVETVEAFIKGRSVGS